MDERTRTIRNKLRRAHRTRARISGTAAKPRLSVFRSNRYLSAQLIDDTASKTLVGMSTKSIKNPPKTKTGRATHLGALLAERAKALHITCAVLHRGPYRYHGQIKALTEALRSHGIRI